MSCACGHFHTITLSDDGTAHSFGRNDNGSLGLGHNNDVSLPAPIPNLPKINMISCGAYFTVCVDYEGFIWSFGANDQGQLGTGNTKSFNVPQKIQDIPPVLSVSCGYGHILIITDDSNLWSCGNNSSGQLCHGDKAYRSKPQKTSFTTISKISAGYDHSLFQNDKGEILHVGIVQKDKLDLMLLKSHQVSYPMHLQTLFNLFVEIPIVYFSIQKEMYILLGIIILVVLVLVTIQIRMN